MGGQRVEGFITSFESSIQAEEERKLKISGLKFA